MLMQFSFGYEMLQAISDNVAGSPGPWPTTLYVNATDDYSLFYETSHVHHTGIERVITSNCVMKDLSLSVDNAGHDPASERELTKSMSLMLCTGKVRASDSVSCCTESSKSC